MASLTNDLILQLNKQLCILINPNPSIHPSELLAKERLMSHADNKEFSEQEQKKSQEDVLKEEELIREVSGLLEEGAEVESEDHHHWTPVMHAFYFNRLKLVSFLFMQGASTLSKPGLPKEEELQCWLKLRSKEAMNIWRLYSETRRQEESSKFYKQGLQYRARHYQLMSQTGSNLSQSSFSEDLVLAAQCFEKAAQQAHHKESMLIMGEWYREGKGVKRDYFKSAEYYSMLDPKFFEEVREKLAEVEYLIAENCMEMARGPGMADETLKYYESSALKGNLHAIAKCGFLYFLRLNHKKSLEYLNRFLNSNPKLVWNDPRFTMDLIRVLRHLALIFDLKGENKKSREYYELAFKEGDFESAYFIGLDEKRQENYKKAFEWFKIAEAVVRKQDKPVMAESILGRIEMQLGVCFEKGQGIEANLDEALRYYQMALNHGEKEAGALIQSLRQKQKGDKDKIPSRKSGISGLNTKSSNFYDALGDISGNGFEDRFASMQAEFDRHDAVARLQLESKARMDLMRSEFDKRREAEEKQKAEKRLKSQQYKASGNIPDEVLAVIRQLDYKITQDEYPIVTGKQHASKPIVKGQYYLLEANLGGLTFEISNMGSNIPGIMKIGLRVSECFVLTIAEIRKNQNQDFYLGQIGGAGLTIGGGKYKALAKTYIEWGCYDTFDGYTLQDNPSTMIVGNLNCDSADIWIEEATWQKIKLGGVAQNVNAQGTQSANTFR